MAGSKLELVPELHSIENYIDQWSYYENIETLQASDGNTYVFRKIDKTPRKIYISVKIKRFGDIDDVRESFRCSLCLDLSWIATKEEYERYLQFRAEQRKIKRRRQLKWQPKFKPRIQFVNNVEEHRFELIEYPPDGGYRISTFPHWIPMKHCGFDGRNTLFVRQKLECDYTFSEPMELARYPFDFQDLSIKIKLSSSTKKAMLIAEWKYQEIINKKTKVPFVHLDPSFSKFDEYDLKGCIVQFGISALIDRSKPRYSEMVISIKLSRKWKPVLLDTLLIIFLVCILSFVGFSIEFSDV
eukprot:148429_1